MSETIEKKTGTRGRSGDDRIVGARIRLRRKVLNLSCVELAVKLGISWQQLQKYESAKNRVSAGRLRDISRTLNVPIEYFFEELPDTRTAARLVGDGDDLPEFDFAGGMIGRHSSAQECSEILMLFSKCRRKEQLLVLELLRTFAH